MLELEGSNMATTTNWYRINWIACHLESLVPEDDGKNLTKATVITVDA